MRKATSMALAVIMSFTGSFAGARGTEDPIPAHKCDKKLVRDVWASGNQELKDAVRRHFTDGETYGRTDGQFCAWLRARYNGETDQAFETEATTCPGGCNEDPVPQTVEVERSVPRDVRRKIREVAVEDDVEVRTQSTGGGLGDLFSNPFVGGLIGGGLAGFLVSSLMNRRQQQRQYFPPPQWGPPWNQPQYPPWGRPPGIMPYPGGQPPGVMPWGGNQFGQQPPWAMPYMGGNATNPWALNYNNYGAGNYYGGGANYYGGQAPPVLPLAPQPFSVMGGQQPQWNLLGR